MEDFNGPAYRRNAANHVALTPTDFLTRSAAVFPERLAVVHGGLRRTYRDLHRRCRRLASALLRRGLRRGDVVAAVLNNSPEHIECLHGVPMAGLVINPLNYRLHAQGLAFCLRHGGAKVLIADREFSASVSAALALLGPEERPLVVDVDDPECDVRGPLVGSVSYEQLLLEGDPDWEEQPPVDEWDAIALLYTSGTTADPKGVIAHHRGGYMNTITNVLSCGVERHATYLWTVPMFHCCGWCFAWTIAAVAGVQVCLRKVEAAKMFRLISEHHVTHMGGAPIVMSSLLSYGGPKTWTHKLKMLTSGAAPPARVIARMQDLGVHVDHVYGLTEALGVNVMCEWKEEWDGLSLDEQAQLKARQGVRKSVEALMVADPATMRPVPKDGRTIGEIFLRGNTLMKGYLKNQKANDESFAGGWFHTGDLGVCDPDGYLRVLDRSKDIIISGGENISSLEVESILYQHPKIAAAAVVARADERWGETPCAYLELREGASMTDEELYGWCQDRMVRYMVPRTFVFEELPKTNTGKVQKHVLRERTRGLSKPPFRPSSKVVVETPQAKL